MAEKLKSLLSKNLKGLDNAKNIIPAITRGRVFARLGGEVSPSPRLNRK